MQKVVTVRRVTIGEGIPKICVPIVGITKEDIISQVKALKGNAFDLVEWRADWFEGVFDLEKVKETAAIIRSLLEDIPLIFTFRTANEGGEKAIEKSLYTKLNKEMAASGYVDIIDVELFTGEDEVRDLVEAAHIQGVKVIISNHDFHKTPSKDILIETMCRMQELGADIPKVAVMPICKRDVLELMLATEEMVSKHATGPIITMSMAGMGGVTRVTGEFFGSAVTFGAVGRTSAPGQMQADDLTIVLALLHTSMQ